MPSWDRVSGGSDKGGDKGHVPKVPASEPRASQPEQVNPPAARNRGHYERSAAEQDSRTAAEGTSGQVDQRRPRDTPPEERGARGREGTAAVGNGSEAGTRTDKTVERFQALFDSQGHIISTYKERVAALKEDNADLEKRNEKLEARNDKLETRLEKKDRTIEQKDQAISAQASEIDRLKAENAALREKANAESKQPKPEASETADKPAAEQSEVERAPNARSEQSRDAQKAEKDTPFYRKFPSEPVANVVTKAGTAIATIAVATGAVNGTAEKVAGGIAAVGWAYMEYRRQASKGKDGQK